MGCTIRNMNETPPGRWRHRIEGIAGPQAWVSEFYAYNDLEEEVVKRYRANGKEVPSDLRQRIIDQMCQQLPDNWCQCGDRTQYSMWFRNAVHEFARVFQGTATLVDWFVAGNREKVSPDVAEYRADRCSTCVFNQPPQGCTTCNQKSLRSKVNEIVGGSATKYDLALNACAICGCELKAKIWLPKEILLRHMSEQQIAQLPPAHNGFKGCWLKE